MGVTWDDVAEAGRTLQSFVREAGLWYTVADERPITAELIAEARTRIEALYGPWSERPA
jgi:hypothetical protein